MCGFALAFLAISAFAQPEGVRLAENDTSFTLTNGILSARIEKKSGTLVALKYRELDLLRGGRGYWSYVGSSTRLGPLSGTEVRADPAENGNERAEVACKFSYDQTAATLPCDVELRYALGRGEQGLHAYAVWTHRAGDPRFSLAEARYALKLNPAIFDFMTIDAKRRRAMPSGADWDRGEQHILKEVRRLTTGRYAGQYEHKYDYSAVLAETPAYGWSSSEHGVGLWIVNPSIEYLAGGPTKVELTGHLDVNPGGTPTLLNMWLGSHYGGSSLAVGKDEAWTKVVGPFLIYCNAAPDHEAMWKDALDRATKEAAVWPYAWVFDPAYPPASRRGSATGTITLRDPLAPGATMRNVQVGLTAPDYEMRGRRGAPAVVDWQRDGKHYQHWTRAEADGRFTIRHARPGAYTLRAIADGVLGEFSKGDVIIAEGQALDLGALTWTPERRGRQLWEIGIPDRSAAEFRHGDHYSQWGLFFKYAEEFPDDVNFVIGKSDWRRDWNYCQPPRLRPDGAIERDSVWTIAFDLDETPRGSATLRLAFCGARAGCRVSVAVNDERVGDTGPLPESGVMHRDGIRGYWFERKITFPGAKLKPGRNVIALRLDAEVWHQGVLYDYVRLEAVE